MTNKTLRGGACLTSDDLADVTALYFEGNQSIYMRAGVEEPEDCAVQVGLVNAYFVKRSDNTVVGELGFADMTNIALEGEQIVITRLDQPPMYIYFAMPNQRRTFLKVVYLRSDGCKGVGFPAELLEDDEPIKHATAGGRGQFLSSASNSPTARGTGERVFPITPHRVAGQAGDDTMLTTTNNASIGDIFNDVNHGKPSLLPKATAPLRAALAVLSQLEEGNAGPSSYERKLSHYCVDALYAPPPPEVCASTGPAFYTSPSRAVVSTTGRGYDGGHRVHRYDPVQEGGMHRTAVHEFLHATQRSSPPPNTAAHANKVAQDDYQHVSGEDPGWVNAAQREQRLRGEIKAVISETNEMEATVQDIQDRKVEAMKMHRQISAGYRQGRGRGGGEDHASKAPGTGALLRKASFVERPQLVDQSTMSLSGPPPSLDVLTKGEPVDKVDIGSLIKKTNPLPPPHDPEELKYTVEREANRWDRRSEGSSRSGSPTSVSLGGSLALSSMLPRVTSLMISRNKGA